jgi:hypothetical protein
MGPRPPTATPKYDVVKPKPDTTTNAPHP